MIDNEYPRTRVQQAPPKYWFASDFHLGHRSVLDFCDRPFEDLLHQDEQLVLEWNKCVKPGDVAFILGDFSFYSPNVTSKILQSMNGQKTLVKGNHDHVKDNNMVKGWNRIVTYHEQKLEDDRFILSHFPFMSWHQQHRGSYHLHGHSHGSLRYPGELSRTRILDVGIDNIAKLVGAYRPLEWNEIKTLLSGRKAGHSDDHHRVRP